MTALVVGIGNGSRGDDAVGPVVAERVARLGLAGVEVVTHEEPLALVEHLAGHEDVVVVDAVRSGVVRPGAVHVIHAGAAPLPRDPVALGSNRLGSHGLGVIEAVELARALGRLPRRLTLVGVEASELGVGAAMSAPVREGLDDAVRAVVDSLREEAGL